MGSYIDKIGVNGTWRKYGLEECPIEFNGELTDYKDIVRKDHLVAIVKKSYCLLPNEEAFRLAQDAAKLAGLQPFIHPYKTIDSEGNCIYDHNRTRMVALWGSKFQFDQDKIFAGVAVRNSIDGSTTFSTSAFSFRYSCENMVLTKAKRLSAQEALAQIWKKHTKSLMPFDVNLKNSMLLVMEQAQDMIRAYEQMKQREVTGELIERIRKSKLSKKILPELEVMVKMDEWELYNSVTEKIWHNEKTGLGSKQVQFDYLHRVMPLVISA